MQLMHFSASPVCRLVMLIGSLIKSASAQDGGSDITSPHSSPTRHARAHTVPSPPLSFCSGGSPGYDGSRACPESPPCLSNPSAPTSPLRMSLSRRESDAAATSAFTRTASAAVDAWQLLGRSGRRFSSGSMHQDAKAPEDTAPNLPAQQPGEPAAHNSESAHMSVFAAKFKPSSFKGLSSMAQATSRLFRVRSRAISESGGKTIPPRPPQPPAPASEANAGADGSTAGSSLGSHSSPQRSPLARSRGLSLTIDEPLAALGPFSPAEQPLSPMSRPLVRKRLQGAKRHSFVESPKPPAPLAQPPSPRGGGAGTVAALPSPTLGLLDAALAFALPSPRRERAQSDVYNSVRGSPQHSETASGMQRSLVMASLARVIPGEAATCLAPQRDAPSSLLEPPAWLSGPSTPAATRQPPAQHDLPRVLTVEEVSRVQTALARELVQFGTELLLLLQQRCERLRKALSQRGAPEATCGHVGDADEPTVEQGLEQVRQAVCTCRTVIHAQTAMLHNLGRWTSVLAPADAGPDTATACAAAQSLNSVPGSPISCGGSPLWHRSSDQQSPVEGGVRAAQRAQSLATARTRSSMIARTASDLALEHAAATLQHTLDDLQVRLC